MEIGWMDGMCEGMNGRMDVWMVVMDGCIKGLYEWKHGWIVG